MNSQNDKNPLRILSANDLYNINEEVTGYAPFVRDEQVLRAAVSRPYLILFGEEQFPSMLQKAAATMHSLAYRHPFVDGNKRTATRATQLFLEANGIQPTWEQAEAQQFVLQIAKGVVDVDEITKWLENHTEIL
ncbi:MAG: type II toxin-antitoxin system death-on-curing family toxin [Anaerolineae bacterium]|nr:type II toxin-antitoxin system death-on-curing family toxin [Anaerolineae bacterium]